MTKAIKIKRTAHLDLSTRAQVLAEFYGSTRSDELRPAHRPRPGPHVDERPAARPVLALADPMPSASELAAAALRSVGALAGVAAVSIGLWLLIGDPAVSPFGATTRGGLAAVVAWTLLGTVAIGFTFGGRPFDRLRRYPGGLAVLGVSIVVGVTALAFLTRLLGRWDPVFSPDGPLAPGYPAASVLALTAFSALVFASVSVGGFPFEQAEEGRGPGALVVAASATALLAVVLVYPALAPGLAAHALAQVPAVVGWLWCTVALQVMAAMIWDGRPWAGVVDRRLRALAALSTTAIGGLVLLWVGRAVVSRVGSMQPMPVLDLAVGRVAACVVLWALIAGLLFPDVARGWPAAVRRRVVTAATVVLALGTYLVLDALDRDAGTFAVLTILVLATYATGFRAPGLGRVDDVGRAGSRTR